MSNSKRKKKFNFFSFVSALYPKYQMLKLLQSLEKKTEKGKLDSGSILSIFSGCCCGRYIVSNCKWSMNETQNSPNGEKPMVGYAA